MERGPRTVLRQLVLEKAPPAIDKKFAVRICLVGLVCDGESEAPQTNVALLVVGHREAVSGGLDDEEPALLQVLEGSLPDICLGEMILLRDAAVRTVQKAEGRVLLEDLARCGGGLVVR